MPNARTKTILSATLWLGLFVGGTVSSADPEKGKREPAVKGDTLLKTYCARCHGTKRQRADLDLESLLGANIPENRRVWERVARMLREREMPPEKSKQPTEAERAAMTEWVRAGLDSFDCSKGVDPGRPTLRRLNRIEYRNTVRDLLGVDYRAADDFPSDEIGYGFDNIGDVLSLPPLLLEKYLDASEEIVEELLKAPSVARFQRRRLQAEQVERDRKVRTPDTNVLGNFALSINREQEIGKKVSFPETGEYVLRARAYGQQAGSEWTKLAFLIDDREIEVVEVEAVSSAPKVYSIKTKVEAGEHKFAVAYTNNYRNFETKDPALRGDRNLIVDWFEYQYASADAAPDAVRLLVASGDDAGAPDRKSLASNVRALARRAYRRPVSDREVDRLVAFANSALEEGDSFETAAGLVIQALLVSTHFLFRVEIDSAPEDPKTIHDVNPYELASRLSYYLWSSLPDDELFRVAADGSLRDLAVLEKQARRMLADPRSKAFVENFAGQWLQTRFLEGTSRDETIFPSFDAKLRSDMAKETLLFFDAVLREKRSVVDLLAGDFTFVNHRLAKHYGLSDSGLSSLPKPGDGFRRVSLKGSPRGGILTQASVLTLTSYPTRTSPVLRGKWILERILGEPPPPPPPDAGELSEEPEAILSGSLRERLEKHRSDPNCGVCHNKLDPLGFALENFDAIGRWREFDGKFLVDSSAALPDGR
ncbi:MAG: DUF1592 domain-containing protein, partial [Planctomycetota bacterium]